MQPINQDQNESSAKPFLWVVLALTMYGIYYFTNGLVWERMPIGDSTNTFLVYSYQYSGFARGEFPLWNPLNRTGEPLYFINVLYLANPIFNLNIGLSLLLGITNIYLSYLIFNFIIIVSYVTGIYLLVLTLTRNHHSSALAAILTLGSGLVAYNMHGNTVLFWIHNVPWIFYGLINYSQKFQFRFLAVVILGFTSALYAYEIVYPLSFIFLALIATMIFYRKSFNLVMLKKISAQHIILVACLALVSCLPMLIIIYKTMGGNYLPPSTRMDLSSLNISEDLRITWDLSFSRLDEFFLICENCWSAMFTGAFWGKYQVARYYIGPVAFPFLILAFLSRNKTVFCIGFTGLLTSLLAGNFFPANLIYHLPFFEWMRYGTNFNMFIQIIVIILSAIGFNFFIKHPFSIGKTTLVRVNVYMLGGYAFLAIVLPGNSLVDSALSLSAVTTISLMVLAYCKDSLPKRLLPHLIIFITLVTVFSFQYLWVKHNPLLKGWKITNQEVLSTKNRVDHSLNFSMERPDSLRTLDEDLSHISTTAFYDEYYSLLSLKDNTYNIKLISRGGFGSVPLDRKSVV